MNRILVVDDCEEMREVLNDLLTDAGYDVCLAEDSETAHSLCVTNSFNLIICDLVLPLDEDSDTEFDSQSAMAGVHAITEFTKKCPGIPIIAISGELTGPALQHMRQFGAINAISKPFETSELLQKVACALMKDNPVS